MTHSEHPTARKIPRWMWVLALVSIIAIVGGMWRAFVAKNNKSEALEASMATHSANLSIHPSEWLTVQEREIPLGIAITGSLTAVDSAIVKARVPGELRELQVREGDSVTRGQILAKVDATDAEARFRQAKLQADAAQAQVAIQQRQYDNNRALVAKGFISDTALATTSANLQAAQASHAAARAAQDAARKTLDDTVLRSPIDGQIARRMAQNGERVGVDAPIVEVVNLSALELEAQLPANDTAHVQVGQSAQLQLRGSSGQAHQTLQAQVVRLNPSATTSNRAVPVYLRMNPTDQVTLRPGMYLEGFIETGKLQALAVPLTSVHTDQPLPYVQSVTGDVVQHSTVELGARSVGETPAWVIVNGLHKGQEILTGSVGRVPAGTKVELLPQPSSATSSL